MDVWYEKSFHSPSASAKLRLYLSLTNDSTNVLSLYTLDMLIRFDFISRQTYARINKEDLADHIQAANRMSD